MLETHTFLDFSIPKLRHITACHKFEIYVISIGYLSRRLILCDVTKYKPPWYLLGKAKRRFT